MMPTPFSSELPPPPLKKTLGKLSHGPRRAEGKVSARAALGLILLPTDCRNSMVLESDEPINLTAPTIESAVSAQGFLKPVHQSLLVPEELGNRFPMIHTVRGSLDGD